MAEPNQMPERIDAISETVTQLLRKQRELEARVTSLEAQRSVVHPTASEPLSVIPPPLPKPVIAPPPVVVPTPAARPPVATQVTEDAKLETAVGLNWLNRIGAITLFLGAAFLFKYGVDNGWIGPVERVLLGLFVGAAALGAGHVMRKRGHTVFAQGVVGLGLSLFYLSFYAAATLYQLISPTLAFLMMTLVTLGAGGLAMLYESQAIAALGMIGGYLTPPALSTGENRPWVLFAYIFLLNCGGLVLARKRQWKPLEILAASATILLYGGWYTRWFGEENKTVATVFAMVFYAQFLAAQRGVWLAAQLLAPAAVGLIHYQEASFLAWELPFVAGGLTIATVRNWSEASSWTLISFWLPFAAWLFTQGTATESLTPFLVLSASFVMFFGWIAYRGRSTGLSTGDVLTLVLNAGFYYGASYMLMDATHHAWMAPLAIAVGVLHIGLAHALKESETALLALGVALILITLAVPIQFLGFRITIVWAMEGAALAWIGKHPKPQGFREAALAVLALVVFRLLAFDMSMYRYAADYAALANARFLTFAASSAALWIATRFFQDKVLRGWTYVAGHAMLLLALCLEVNGWVTRSVAPEDQTSTLMVGISILMTIYAVLLVVLGVATRVGFNRILGLCLVIFVIAKLYLIDVWTLGRGFRITAFLALGVLLLLVSFLYSRFKPALNRLLKSESE